MKKTVHMPIGDKIVRRLAALFFISFAPLLSGCAPPSYISQAGLPQLKELKVIGVVPPDIRVYSLSGTGVAERTDNISEAARDNTLEAVKGFFRDSGIATKILDETPETRDELMEVQALSRAVSTSIREFWNPLDVYYRYSLGNMEKLADKYGVDGFIFINGSEVFLTSPAPIGKTLMALAITSIYGPRSAPKHNTSNASIIYASPTGEVIWCGYRENIVHFAENFRSPEKNLELVRSILSDFPIER